MRAKRRSFKSGIEPEQAVSISGGSVFYISVMAIENDKSKKIRPFYATIAGIFSLWVALCSLDAVVVGLNTGKIL